MVSNNISQYSSETRGSLATPILLQFLLNQTGWNCDTFIEKTELDRNFHSVIQRGVERNYSKRIIVTLAIAFQLDYSSAEMLLRSAGHCLSLNNSVDKAYFLILTDESCSDIVSCNDRLEKLRIDKKYWLGTLPREF